MDYDYNTQRKKLILPEYGRNIQKLVDQLKSIDDRDKRNQLAHIIIDTMSNLNNQVRDVIDFKHKLWEQLALMGDYELDIDFPHEISKNTKTFFETKPDKLNYNTDRVSHRHYGANLKKFINYAAEMEDGEEKSALIKAIANHMKKQYLMWNKESVQDDVIFEDLKKFSNGRIEVKNLSLNQTKDILTRNKRKRTQRKKHK